MNIFKRLERGLFHLLGPAQVDNYRDTKPADEPKHMVDGGYERRGTEGNYYIVKKDDETPS